ncbi:hydroxysqualene dehydroxylase [Amycolatopsis anabasis]|uniref:hydroxysqualene dehydroxylase n=1 Tax=Amycolatopsis anabasis TaxID=1840409 RepID=UPI00131C0C31|nr:FAD-dependent oxidoreductase [Amycolatopsis anabasis]
MNPSEKTGARGGVTRRSVVRGTLAAAAAATAVGITGAAAASPLGARAAGAGRRVAVLGGGIGGLTAAHELAERGFAVTVYERKALGGKARSIPVPGTGRGGRLDLPGEHGFRFFPGIYQNLPETMSRIPFPGNTRGVRDNLVVAEQGMAAWKGRKLLLPTSVTKPANFTPPLLLEYFRSLAIATGAVPPQDAALFASKVVAFFTSGPKRRWGQWENVSYLEGMAADRLSPTGYTLLVDALITTLVAAKAEKASALTMALMGEAFILSILGAGPYTDADQLLNGPTNEVFIDPWVAHLRGMGVRFEVGRTVTGLSFGGGRITGAAVTDPAGRTSAIDADWYVLAVPVERAIPLLNPQILAADPGLRGLWGLHTDWMNGIQIFTTAPVPIAEGHVAYIEQPWALTSISQGQFWRNDIAAHYGDGTVVDCLSIDLSNWDAPGVVYGKTAKQCTRRQIVTEVLTQIRRSLPGGEQALPDSILHSWFLDPAITGEGTSAVANDEPLLINTVSSWRNRPEAVTRIPNLFLAADYVRTNINLATMEGANEAGRAAANGILAAAGSSASRATVKTLYEPPELRPFRLKDDFDYSLGLPNQFDAIAPSWP